MSYGTHACEACGSRGSNVRHRTRTKSGPRLGKERPPVTSRDLGGRSKGGVPPLARSHNVLYNGTNSHGTHLKLAQRGAAQRYGRASRGSGA